MLARRTALKMLITGLFVAIFILLDSASFAGSNQTIVCLGDSITYGLYIK